MASASITARSTKTGRRFVVRYRLGGRSYPIVHGGSFRTLKEARARRDLIAGELANGRNPVGLLGAMVETPQVRSFASAYDEFVASRVDVSEATLENYVTHRVRLVDLIGDHDTNNIDWHDAQTVVSTLAEELSPLSVKNYLGTLRMVLDFADRDPNPARDRRIKLPRPEESIPDPPSASAVASIVSNAPRKWRLAIRVLEQTGMRVGELAKLEWGDVDRANLRFRIRSGKTAAARRWVAVPDWLMGELEQTCPPDDRASTRRLFPGANRQTVGNAMRNACRTAGLPDYSPHDLRHRYISVKVREGIPVTDIAAQVGHARKSLTLDTYAHVLIDES